MYNSEDVGKRVSDPVLCLMGPDPSKNIDPTGSGSETLARKGDRDEVAY